MKGSVNVFVFLTLLTLHRIILGCKCIILLDMFRYIRDFFSSPFSIYRLHFRSSRYIDVVYPLQTGSKAQWVDPFISKDTFSSSSNVASSFTSTNLFMTDFLSNFSLIFKNKLGFLSPSLENSFTSRYSHHISLQNLPLQFSKSIIFILFLQTWVIGIIFPYFGLVGLSNFTQNLFTFIYTFSQTLGVNSFNTENSWLLR